MGYLLSSQVKKKIIMDYYKRSKEFLKPKDNFFEFTESCEKKLKLMGMIKVIEREKQEGMSWEKDLIPIERKKKLEDRKDIIVNFRYPKICYFLISRPCDEIIKVNKR